MKYEILKFDTMEVDFHRVYRIKNVNTGELGGYIENEDNLSQEGNCWVHRNAIVYGRARVRDNAQIMDCAKVCGQNVCLCKEGGLRMFAYGVMEGFCTQWVMLVHKTI